MTTLCFLWHMHQPFYKDLWTGEYKLPWTRLHALKDYAGMVEILRDFPQIHQTFNLVPSMVVQIEEYADGKASDPFLDVAVTPAEELTESQRNFMLRYLFQANVEHMIDRYPRYRELYESRGQPVACPFKICATCRCSSQLAWFDEDLRAHDSELQELVRKERELFARGSGADGAKTARIAGAGDPGVSRIRGAGADRNLHHAVLSSDPAVDLRFGYRGGLASGRSLCRRGFSIPKTRASSCAARGAICSRSWGSRPPDCGRRKVRFPMKRWRWPSIADSNGLRATTACWRARSNQNAGPELTYQAYRWNQNGREIRLVFRDHWLSDLIGFTYQRMAAAEAAAHFLTQIRNNTGEREALVPIILDGENAWEWYEENGRPFLRELYRRISEDPNLEALTVSEALGKFEARPLEGIFPGSWVNANFDIWIGAEEDNLAWELLHDAHRAYDDATGRAGEYAAARL